MTRERAPAVEPEQDARIREVAAAFVGKRAASEFTTAQLRRKMRELLAFIDEAG
jgi:hypothetical protein